jgi:DNA-binding XRE family transcriptional regulator
MGFSSHPPSILATTLRQRTPIVNDYFFVDRRENPRYRWCIITEGTMQNAKKLKFWLLENDFSQTDLARKIGVTPLEVSKVANAIRHPNAALALAIEDITGISAQDWRKK